MKVIILLLLLAPIFGKDMDGSSSFGNGDSHKSLRQRDLKVPKGPSDDCTEEFKAAQGSASSFYAPVLDHLGWGDTDFSTFGVVDYMGYMNEYTKALCGKDLGTTVEVSCTHYTQGNRYTVKIHTENANMWMMETVPWFLEFTQDYPDLTATCPENDFMVDDTLYQGCGTDRAFYGIRADTGGICKDDTNLALATVDILYDFKVKKGKLGDLTNTNDYQKLTTTVIAEATGAQLRAKQGSNKSSLAANGKQKLFPIQDTRKTHSRCILYMILHVVTTSETLVAVKS